MNAYNNKEIHNIIIFIKKKSKSKEESDCFDGAGKASYILSKTGKYLYMLAEETPKNTYVLA